ncbi:MAG: hypothetical protein ACRCXQ_13665, partial [Vagococcus fluvialis]
NLKYYIILHILINSNSYKIYCRKNVQMIVYENNKNDFIKDVRLNKIADKIKNKMVERGIGGGSPGEIQS